MENPVTENSRPPSPLFVNKLGNWKQELTICFVRSYLKYISAGQFHVLQNTFLKLFFVVLYFSLTFEPKKVSEAWPLGLTLSK